MNARELEQRSKQFALRIIRLVAEMPKDRLGDVLGRQILKSGTSIGANYSEATRASSRKHFVSLIEIACREAGETAYWLDLLAESGVFTRPKLGGLRDECQQLIAILTASARTAKRRRPSDDNTGS